MQLCVRVCVCVCVCVAYAQFYGENGVPVPPVPLISLHRKGWQRVRERLWRRQKLDRAAVGLQRGALPLRRRRVRGQSRLAL